MRVTRLIAVLLCVLIFMLSVCSSVALVSAGISSNRANSLVITADVCSKASESAVKTFDVPVVITAECLFYDTVVTYLTPTDSLFYKPPEQETLLKPPENLLL